MPELIYKRSCPYCRTAARAVRTIDVRGAVATTPIESPRGERLIEDHHGEMVMSPHLFTEEKVYYGVVPVVKGLVKSAAF